MRGLVTRAMNSMQPTSTKMMRPYSTKMSRPEVATELYTRPRMPKGAQAMTHRTTLDTASDTAVNRSLVFCLAERRAMPSTTAQARMPM